MFGIGTAELIVILVIGIMVVGPERMVEFAREAGTMLRKFRSETDGVTKEFREALALDEMQETVNEMKDSVQEINGELRTTVGEAETSLEEAKEATASAAAAANVPFSRPQVSSAAQPKPAQTSVLADTAAVEIDVAEYVAPEDEQEAIELEQVVLMDDEDDGQSKVSSPLEPKQAAGEV